MVVIPQLSDGSSDPGWGDADAPVLQSRSTVDLVDVPGVRVMSGTNLLPATNNPHGFPGPPIGTGRSVFVLDQASQNFTNTIMVGWKIVL